MRHQMLLIVALSVAVGCGGEEITQDDAHRIVWELPEVQAWADYLRNVKEYEVRPCTMDLDNALWVIDGQRYWAVGFYEDQRTHYHRWVTFLVRDDGKEILADYPVEGSYHPLEEWRREKKPMTWFPKNTAAQPTDDVPATLPIRWTHHVDLKDLSELKPLSRFLDKPVMSDNNPAKLGMIKGDHRLVVTTPRQWLELRGKGYTHNSYNDMITEYYFKYACLPHLFLASARPAKVSHVRDFRLTDRPLELLPPELGLNFMEEPNWERFIARVERGETWGQIRPELKVEDSGEHSITLSDDGEQNYIEILAWGDFDHDGIEDVLLYVMGRPIGGSFYMRRYVVLTRKEPNGKFIISFNE